MFDRYDAGEQAVLVHIYFTQDKDMEDLQEFESLVSSAGVEALQVITGSRKAPHPKYFVGEGKAVEIAEAVKATGASVVLFDHALSPAQERNLERLCECRVIDRTGLILDIFAQRARTHEGKLQVELAQLRGEDFSQLHIVGGGCQNTLLNQLCADACGIRVIAGPVEASTLGNIGIQLMTLDELNNVDDFRQVVSTTANLTTFTPNPDSEIAHYVAQIHSTRQTKELCA